MKRWLGIMLFLTGMLLADSATFHRAISSSPTRLNPLLATDSSSSEIADWIFNGLLKFDADGSIVPDLAQSWHFEDNRTLLFKLRQGVRWHDGHPFTARDVKFTYDFLRSDKVVTPYKSDFKYVKSVETPDEYTVRVHYAQPYFKALSIWMMGMLPEHLWKKEKDPMRSRLNKLPVGTGPYKMTKPFGINERIVLKANEHYYEHPPFIKKQIYHYIGDPATEFMMLKAGKLDIGGLSPLQLTRQAGPGFREKYAIYEQLSYSYTYLGFNLRDPKFRDRRVRRAIALGIDRQEIIDLLFFSHGSPCYGPFMPGSAVYPKDFTPEGYNPRKAKELLKQAGYDTKHPLKFTLVTNTGNETRIYAAQIIQQQLLKIGVQMKIRTMEWQAFLNTVVFPRHFEAVLLGWSLSLIPDAYSIWHSDGDKKGGFNFVGYHNPQVDRLIKESERLVDPEAFAANYRKIFKLIVRDYPYVFLYIPNSITAVSRRIKGVTPSIIGIQHNFIDWKIRD
ncbi:peptide-binding protein [Nitratifractor salsuginis]|uniref:Extracellular solute-binding protein family 5 n=1 Tax=Nitratifractor salsuginis (strain DSM 16511 / JCM 12458 / E9I37-1) TaxID=749222 RepID=E6X1D6_NITSE|nr:peptide-binding protein [Nitratifractor salsuginis]ADV46998.1 extracellular solute-binding protein family 5 [Nitratifractor salsuginis DSM 16511]